jgi:DNA repair exonuclease SbcCD ATPase subunit
MRLNSIALKNYIGIYNGMHKHTICIDFTKCRNNIVVIKGDNGSGKSSLFKAIHPFSDPGYCLIDGLEAIKDISYQLNDGRILAIRYIYPVDEKGNRKSTQCYVFINGTLMNPNHNVTEGKDIICDTLDIDTTFLPLSQLSSDDRGLADKTPSQRKTFINRKIIELNVYNEIYKKLSKKSSQMKSLVNSISLKIRDIGDIKAVSANISMWNNQLADLESQKLNLTAELSSIKTRMNMMYDNNTNPEEAYNKAVSELVMLKESLSNYQFNPSLIDTDKKDNLINSITLLESEIKLLESKIDFERKSISDYNSKIDTNVVKLSSFNDYTLIDNYKNKIDAYEKKQKELKAICNAKYYDKYINYQLSEFDMLMSIINRIISSFNDLKNLYNDYHIINKTIDIIKAHYHGGKLESKSVEELDSMKQALNDMKILLNNQNIYRKQSKGVENIPKDCIHKSDCVFVKTMVEAYNNLLSEADYNNLVHQIDELSKDINNYNIELRNDQISNECATAYIHAIDSIKAYYPILNKFNVNLPENNMDGFIDTIFLNKDIIYWLNIDLSAIKEIKNIIIELNNINTNLSSLKEKYSNLSVNKDLIDYLSTELKEFKKEKSIHMASLNALSESLNKHRAVLDNYRSTLSQIDENIKLKEEYDKIVNEEIAPREKILSEFKGKYEEYHKLANDYNKCNNVLNDLITNRIPYLNSLINDNSFKLKLYNTYVDEYNRYRDDYDRFETIKYYCSPTTGIQTVFMGKYMNDIIDISNSLLSKFFGGAFLLQPFVINEKEFKIPVKGEGILNDDISSMSTSQICMISMIISFALMSRSSTIYNIIKMDEIDGGLDTNNRLAFFNVLSILMNYLNCNQCIMISHNSELNLVNMDIVLLKNSDPNIQLDGNIIYNYDEDLTD